jgi:transcriptional regulator NrdR family protein
MALLATAKLDEIIEDAKCPHCKEKKLHLMGNWKKSETKTEWKFICFGCQHDFKVYERTQEALNGEEKGNNITGNSEEQAS